MATPKKVLIVEDERPLAHALELKLQHEGIVAVIATNGEECLQQLDSQDFYVVLAPGYDDAGHGRLPSVAGTE